jgi:hypothetical protein
MIKNRYEIKFVLNELEYSEVKYFLKKIKSFNSFPQRNVNSLYFDSLDFNSVKDNITGVSERKKMRFRWYEKSEFSPRIEIKNRFSRVGSKNTYLIDSVNLEDLKVLSAREFKNKLFKNLNFKNKENAFFYKYFIPTLSVTYDRDYYETNSGLRITIDSEIKFQPVSLGRPINFHKKINYPNKVMELKFPIELKDHVQELIRSLNLIPKRHSKYLIGLSKIGYCHYV